MHSYLKKLLHERIHDGNPIRVALAGGGFMGRAVTDRLLRTEGISIVSFVSRKLSSVEKILSAYTTVKYRSCVSEREMHRALDIGAVPYFEDINLISCAQPEVIIDLTRNIENGIKLAEIAMDCKCHFIAGAEFDAVLGPLFAQRARDCDIVYTNISGDEPGCIMDLYNYAGLAGFHIVAIGKFKKFLDPYSTPASVMPWVSRDLDPWLVSSAADGTKMSIEMTIAANATGFVPDIRGMHCPRANLDEITSVLCPEKDGGILRQDGVVEVVCGTEPSGGVFAVVSGPVGEIGEDMKFSKMGDGPYYLLYTPYHMPGIEIIFSILRAALLRDPTIQPLGRPYAEVMAYAKRDLAEGAELDDIGGYDYFGVIDKAAAIRRENALNLGLAKGAIIRRTVRKGDLISLCDVDINTRSGVYTYYNDLTDDLQV